MNIEQMVGTMTREQAREMAFACLSELPETEQMDFILQFARLDEDFVAELIAQLEDGL